MKTFILGLAMLGLFAVATPSAMARDQLLGAATSAQTPVQNVYWRRGYGWGGYRPYYGGGYYQPYYGYGGGYYGGYRPYYGYRPFYGGYGYGYRPYYGYGAGIGFGMY
jgi:hypothetical protein